MTELFSASALAVLTLTSVAVAAPVDPAYSSRDLALKAQLATAPVVEGSIYLPFFDPAMTSRDREIADVGYGVDAIATHGTLASTFDPSMRRLEGSND